MVRFTVGVRVKVIVWDWGWDCYRLDVARFPCLSILFMLHGHSDSSFSQTDHHTTHCMKPIRRDASLSFTRVVM